MSVGGDRVVFGVVVAAAAPEAEILSVEIQFIQIKKYKAQ